MPGLRRLIVHRGFNSTSTYFENAGQEPTSIFYGFKPLISFPDPINLKNSAHLEIIAKYFSLINQTEKQQNSRLNNNV